ncbi:MAG: HEAT repeat domain-containing protein [Planctomycetota bacterium]
MLNLLRIITQNWCFQSLMICAVMVSFASAQTEMPKRKIQKSQIKSAPNARPQDPVQPKQAERPKPDSSSWPGKVRDDYDARSPNSYGKDDDLLDDLDNMLDNLIAKTFGEIFNSGFQGSLNWLSFRRDPAQGLTDPYVQNVIRLKQSSSSKIRMKAAASLVQIPVPATSKPFLKEALRTDPSVEVRKTSAIALGRIGDDQCREYLQKAMKYDSSEEVRIVCAAVLAKIQTQQAQTNLQTPIHCPK